MGGAALADGHATASDPVAIAGLFCRGFAGWGCWVRPCARLLGGCREAPALPQQKRSERASEAVDARVAGPPRRLRRRLVHAPPPVLPVVELLLVAVVGRGDPRARRRRPEATRHSATS
jgi:hypothetical protein